MAVLLAAGGVSLLSLIAALVAEVAFVLEPCIMCIYQRIPFIAVILFTLIAIILRKRKGVARLMLAHALQSARDAGFYAMQFNFVLTSNEGAIRLWERAGFDTVGRIPEAFDHPTLGLVDALVMYKKLAA